MSSVYLDGLLEGHEAPAVKTFYQIWMFCFLTFCTFGVVSSFATIPQPRHTIASILVSVAVLGFMLFALFMIKNYREMNMDPVWRRAAFFVMALAMVLASANAVLMHQSFQPLDGPCPTPAPTPLPTPVPAASTPAPGAPPPPGSNTTRAPGKKP